jgi:hypothetical protein
MKKVFPVLLTLVLVLALSGSVTYARHSGEIPECPCQGGWISEGTGAEILHDCFCWSPYFYGVTGKVPHLPIEYWPAIDWQCGSFDTCVLPVLPVIP